MVEGWARADAAAELVVGGARLPLPAGQPVPFSVAVRGGDASVTATAPVVVGGLGWAPAERIGRTVVLVVIDTLRADRLGAWGSERATPHLDALAAESLRATAAYSPAPWTLPSMRGALTGRQPEAFDPADTLQAALLAAGWRTEAVVANPWLGAAHGLAEHWGAHTLASGASATAQVDAALALLGQDSPRDRLLLVHLQDPHLPYREPEPFRSRWAGPRPDGLPAGFTGAELRALGRLAPGDARRAHVVDRYDQNVAFVDQELGRLLAAVPDDALLAVFSDHGEELWEHGEVEHGHALWPELLHVPLLLRGPGLTAGAQGAPTTLLDLAPTVRAWAGLPPDPAAAGLDLAGPVPADRRLVAGRLLYGPSGWLVRQGGGAVWRDGGQWHALDSAAGRPREPAPAERAAAAVALSDRLGLEVPLALRVARPGVAPGTSSSPASTVRLTCPGGFAAVWAEPRPLVTRTPPRVEGDRLVLERDRGAAPTGEAFAVPADPAADCTLEVEDPATGETSRAGVPASLAEAAPAVRAGPRLRAAAVDRQRSPQLPVAPTATADPRLEALGYVDAPPFQGGEIGSPPPPPEPESPR